jgi:ABC-type branched-subunit amino acid transport system substrate-binding protein
MALEEINADPALLPDTVLVGVTADDACTKSGGITAPLSQCGPLSEATGCTDKYFDVIVGSGCSSSCQATARLAEAWEVPQVSWACTSPSLSNTNEYPWFVRAVSSNRIIVDTALSLMRDKGWTHLGSIVETERLFLSTRDYLLTTASTYSVTVVADESFASAVDEADTVASIRARLEAIKRTGVRVWATGAYAGNTRLILKEAGKLGMTTDGWQVILMGSTEDCLLANPACPAADGATVRETDAEVLAATRGAVSFLPSKATGPLYEAYEAKMVARDDTGDSADQLLSWAVYAYEATYSVARALHAFDSNPRLNRTGFYDAIKAVAFEGPTGWYEYDANGDRAQKYDIVNFQWDDYDADVGVDTVPWTTVATFELLGENAGISYESPVQYTAGRTSPPEAMPSQCPTNQGLCEVYRNAAYRQAGAGMNASLGLQLGKGYGIFAPSSSCDVCSGFGVCSNVTRSCECSPLSYDNDLVLADGASLAVDNVTRTVFRGQMVASGKTCDTIMTRYMLPEGIVVLSYIMALVLLGVSVSFFVFYHVNRAHSVIRFSSRKFCQIVHAGGIVAALTVIVVVQDPLQAPWKCALEPWLLAFSYTLVFAPLMAKTYKVGDGMCVSGYARLCDGCMAGCQFLFVRPSRTLTPISFSSTLLPLPPPRPLDTHRTVCSDCEHGRVEIQEA